MCYYEIQILGKFQSWPNGTDCKSVSFAFSGSNPLIPTNLLHLCGCSSVVEPQPSKLVARVRFPSPAPCALSSAG